MPVGGDITEITFNHPTIGTGVFYPKAAEDSTYDLGGLRSNDDDSGVDGSGAMIDQMNRKRWSFEVAIAADMNNRKDIEKVNLLAADPVPADWTMTNINGTVYGGKGKPVGDLQLNGNTSMVTLKVSGGGKMASV